MANWTRETWRAALTGKGGKALETLERGSFAELPEAIVDAIELHKRTAKDDRELLRKLLVAGADPNGITLRADEFGSASPVTPLVVAIERDLTNVARMLLANGAKADWASEHTSIVHTAARFGFTWPFEYALAKVPIDFVVNGRTPLAMAMESKEPAAIEAITYLLKKGAKPTAGDMARFFATYAQREPAERENLLERFAYEPPRVAPHPADAKLWQLAETLAPFVDDELRAKAREALVAEEAQLLDNAMAIHDRARVRFRLANRQTPLPQMHPAQRFADAEDAAAAPVDPSNLELTSNVPVALLLAPPELPGIYRVNGDIGGGELEDSSTFARFDQAFAFLVDQLLKFVEGPTAEDMASWAPKFLKKQPELARLSPAHLAVAARVFSKSKKLPKYLWNDELGDSYDDDDGARWDVVFSLSGRNVIEGGNETNMSITIERKVDDADE